jgi:1-acyl-sn-glycerol-3-phosphate acyltransferase
MFRATITVVLMSLVVIAVGVPIFVVGIVYPWRRLCDWGAALWSRTILHAAGVELHVEGREVLLDGTPRFFMGNHQSALDIPILLAVLDGHVRFMAKDTLFKIPLFGWILHRYGFAPIARTNARVTLRSLERMLEELRRDPISMAVFPEGTRSRDGRLLPFRRGTMKVGQRSGLPIVPFSIDGSIAVHHRDHFAAHPGKVRIVFAPPIPAEQAASMTAAELHAYVVSTIARQLGQPVHSGDAAEAAMWTAETA